MILSGVGIKFLTTLVEVGVGFFVRLNSENSIRSFLHRTSKLRIPIEMV